MRHSTRYTLAALAAAALVLLPAMAGALPFRTTSIETFVGVEDKCLVYTGTGSAPVLGPYTDVVRLDTQGNRLSGTATLTAAGGDQVFLVFTQTWDKETESWSGPYTIVGGTGRFAGASGVGWTYAKVQPDGTGLSTMEGTIGF